MPQIYVVAILVTAAALGVFAAAIWKIVPGELRRALFWLFMLELPLQPLVFVYVRRPIHHALKAALVPGHERALEYISLLYAPVTEELAKLLPVIVLILILRSKAQLSWRAMLVPIGFGFGIGEAWLIACLTAEKPEIASLAWYQLMPFFGERFMVCFIHGGMTCAGLYFSLVKGRWVLGTLLAMTLHFLLNAPIYFLGPGQLNLSNFALQVSLQLWTTLAFLISLAVMLGGENAVRLGKFLFGNAECPRCGAVYARSLWAFNFGPRRYEKCPKCGTWNFTKEKKAGE